MSSSPSSATTLWTSSLRISSECGLVADLISAGYIDRTRDGRRNSYEVRLDLPVALPKQRDIDLRSPMAILLPAGSSDERRAQEPGSS